MPGIVGKLTKSAVFNSIVDFIDTRLGTTAEKSTTVSGDQFIGFEADGTPFFTNHDDMPGGGGGGTGAGTISSQDTSGCVSGALVYLSSNATWSPLSVHSDATLGGAVGVCGTVHASNGTVITKGEVTDTGHGLTANDALWADPADTDAWTTTQPDTDGQFLKKIGWVLDANTLWIDVEEEYSELGDAVWTDDHASITESLDLSVAGHTNTPTETDTQEDLDITIKRVHSAVVDRLPNDGGSDYTQLAASGKTRIVFLGDSNTWTTNPATQATLGSYFWQVIQNWYRSSNTYCLNQGDGGDTSADMLARYTRDVAGRFVQDADNILVIMAGTNDADDSVVDTTYETNMDGIIDAAATLGYTVYVILVPPWVGDSTKSDFITSYNVLMEAKEIADGNFTTIDFAGAVSSDTYTWDLQPTWIKVDGIHFEDAGHAGLADLVSTQLETDNKGPYFERGITSDGPVNINDFTTFTTTQGADNVNVVSLNNTQTTADNSATARIRGIFNVLTLNNSGDLSRGISASAMAFGVTSTSSGTTKGIVGVQGFVQNSGTGVITTAYSSQFLGPIVQNGATTVTGITLDLGTPNIVGTGTITDIIQARLGEHIGSGTISGDHIGMQIPNLTGSGKSAPAGDQVAIDIEEQTGASGANLGIRNSGGYLAPSGDVELTTGQFTGAGTGLTGVAASLTTGNVAVGVVGAGTVYLMLAESSTGNQGVKTDGGLSFDTLNNILSTTTFDGALSGNSATATKWLNTRTIGMSGDISSDSVNIDGSGNVTITNTVISDSSHTIVSHDTTATGADLNALVGMLGRAWSADLSGSRSIDVSYRNTNAYPIEVAIRCTSDAAGALARVRISPTSPATGNVVFDDATNAVSGANLYFTVPPNDYYLLNITGAGVENVVWWKELS